MDKRWFDRRALLVAAFALLLSVLAPRTAHASREADMVPDLLLLNAVFAGASVFGTMDIVYLAQGKPLPVGWSIAQLLVPTPLFYTLAFVDADQDVAQLQAFSAVLATWFLVHGGVSLTIELTRDEDPPSGVAAVDVGIAPLPQGAIIYGSARL